VQIENGAGVRLFCPRQKAFVVFFDEPNRAVDKLNIIPAKIIAYLAQETLQRIARHVDLRDNFRGGLPGVETSIDAAMIVCRVDAELMGIGPINLPVSRQIISGIALESLTLVSVGKKSFLQSSSESSFSRSGIGVPGSTGR